MGNTISFVTLHGKRLINRYNAQYRAHKFLDKEKLPSAPRHPLPDGVQEDPDTYEYLHIKDPSLEKFLKDVYIKSHGEEPLATDHKNPERPLPVYSETSKKNPFQEPTEMIKGLVTLTQFFEFRNAHENDPVKNNASAIAKNYCLNVKKVENLLKYYSVFTVYESNGKATQLKRNYSFIDVMSVHIDESVESDDEKKLIKGDESQQVKLGKTQHNTESQKRETLKS